MQQQPPSWMCRVIAAARRIYQLLGEVIAFQRATGPLKGMLEGLLRGSDKYEVDVELQRSFRDVLDHVLRVTDRADTFRVLPENALTVRATLVTQQQNGEMRQLSEANLAQVVETRRVSEVSLEQSEDVKKISAWAAIAAMGVCGLILHTIFRRRRWL